MNPAIVPRGTTPRDEAQAQRAVLATLKSDDNPYRCRTGTVAEEHRLVLIPKALKVRRHQVICVSNTNRLIKEGRR